MTDKPKIEPGQVASPERPVHLVHDIGDRPTIGEIDGTLAAINYMRRQLDVWNAGLLPAGLLDRTTMKAALHRD